MNKTLRTLLLAACAATGALQTGCGTLMPGSSERPQGQAAVERTGAAVKKALVDELGIAASAIGVSVDGGKVTLTGFVESDAERRRAVTAAQRVDRVDRVDDRIEVK